MKSLRLILTCTGAILALGVAFPAPALAYLDGGTGSLVFQWVIAGAIGAGFAIRMSWKHIVGLFSRKPAKNADDA